jgi:hypothetical protein
MEKREQDPTGDYGYDLAHEATSADRSAPAEGDGSRPSSAAHASGRSDQMQDYSYDEAHDF